MRKGLRQRKTPWGIAFGRRRPARAAGGAASISLAGLDRVPPKPPKGRPARYNHGLRAPPGPPQRLCWLHLAHRGRRAARPQLVTRAAATVVAFSFGTPLERKTTAISLWGPGSLPGPFFALCFNCRRKCAQLAQQPLHALTQKMLLSAREKRMCDALKNALEHIIATIQEKPQKN